MLLESSLIAVSTKNPSRISSSPSLKNSQSFLKRLIFAKLLGNFWNFKHHETSRIARDVKYPMLLGSSLIPIRFKRSSFKNFISGNAPIDECNLRRLVQPSIFNLSKFGILEKFGILMSCCELLISTNFNFS